VEDREHRPKPRKVTMAIYRIEAIIRPEMLEPLRIHLEEMGYPGMMVTEIEGHGKQGGTELQWRGTKIKTTFVPKVRVEVVTTDKYRKKVISTVMEVCHTGRVGDGKIFITKIEDAIRISTKEKGEKAVL
jgi:nitrogen regulatory protein P-II 1